MADFEMFNKGNKKAVEVEKQSNLLEKYFHLSERGTNVKTEMLAGLTTFIAMSYIIFVIPNQFLVSAGVPQGSATAATILSTAVATLLVGIYANLPIAMGPGLGLGAVFAFVMVGSMGLNWQTALGAVFISGVIFLILAVTNITKSIIEAIPKVLKSAIGVGIGLFISFIGFKNAGIIVSSESSYIALGNLADPSTILAIMGLIITCILMARDIKGAFLIGIVSTTILGMIMGVTKIPTNINDFISYIPPLPTETFGELDVVEAIKYGLFSIIFTITIVDLFDNIGTIIAVSGKAGLLDENGNLPGINKGLIAGSFAAMAGGVLGTCTVTTYLESASGVAEGGRTGLTAVTTGVLFLGTLFFTPLAGLVPGAATAPILIILGALMIGDIVHINFTDFTDGLPAFLTIILMPFTSSIVEGMSFGFISYTLLKLVTGKYKEINPIMYVLSIIFIIHFSIA
ncbi:putative MFS transporter, AGZA family, xanthine/uracil permease [Garciella nitratireducens DSM 15102]|uniref:Putative MFS transporter, AGZA family, xanthine/uracil permease n=2 Tax=Garciella TaxID=218204 RepID=A0A1T4MQA7_9FIRM|nr:NCS2 family permease [Garciella nitratireducens]SJZ68918.1 putative MFS transporter, AGZA family, xanthine/uracil permease [Garciella nitratireducens DSM 15102]